ncbi:hypothetical protein QJS10_CPA06g00762 [Acorus calamus]|uniref:Uncharacterized protein n=1 Tax=Acorus calamus TaxID=4465 RepID=A0AAV9EK58_ACOCL|nr:hypothetical protein QJS10_CPA06g00762 [Acorus calamus]
MASFSYAMGITCTMNKVPPTKPPPHLTSSLSSTPKPLLKEMKQLPLKIQVAESIRGAYNTMLEAFMDSTFKFVDTPELPGNYAPVDEIGEAVMLSDIEGEVQRTSQKAST